MNHKVALKDISEAMDIEIVIASSYRPVINKSKEIKFNPSRLTYRVRYEDGSSITSSSYKNPIDAIAKYNNHNV